METNPDVLTTVRDLIFQAQVQAAIVSAVIAAVVALIVARLATERERRARKFQRAERLLREVYGSMANFVSGTESLIEYIDRDKSTLEKIQGEIDSKCRALVVEALNEFVPKKITFGASTEEKTKRNDSELKVNAIGEKLRPCLKKEIAKLEKVIRNETSA